MNWSVKWILLFRAMLGATVVLAAPFGNTFFGSRGSPAMTHIVGGSKDVDAAIRNAKIWLAAHQNKDGKFSGSGFSHNCTSGKCEGVGKGITDTGLTGLVLLAFTGSGETGTTGKYRKLVNRTVKYLKRHRQSDGSFGMKRAGQPLYQTAWAMLALSEFNQKRLEDEDLKKSLGKSAEYLLNARNRHNCWGKIPKAPVTDVWTTVWCVAALRTYLETGGKIDRKVFVAPRKYFNEKELTREKNPIMLKSACAFGAMLAFGKKKDSVINGLKSMSRRHRAQWSDPDDMQPAYAFFTSHVLYQYGESFWVKWNNACRRSFVKNQFRDAGKTCRHGSFKPAGCMKIEGGRMYATAMAVLVMTVYTRYGRFLE